ncbi:hypothetical protein ACFFRR_002393 [Megaselia abdita]
MATQRIQEIRRDKPTLFCAISTVTLGFLAIFGHVVSGSAVVVLGLIAAALISTKYNFKIVKIERSDFTWSTPKVVEKAPVKDEDDEFLPEETESNMFVLERASDLASLASSPAEENEDKSDEIPSDLLIQDSIPEINEDDSTDDEIVKPMEFKKSHFKKDSSFSASSSSEDELSKGLQFPDHTTVDGSKKNPPKSSGGSSFLPSLVSGVVQIASERIGKATGAITSAPAITAANAQPPKPTPKTFEISTDDESDFEILEKDDFK